MSRKIVKNSLANLMGTILPAAASLLTIPFIVRAMGDANYGVLTMVTAIVGYFALLDLNLTSGAVKFVAEYNALGKRRELHQVITFGGMVYLVIGLVGMAGIYLFADELTHYLFKLPAHLVPLTIQTIELSAIGFLFGQMQSYFQSIPQALQRYDVAAKTETAFGVLVPILTVIVLGLGYGLYEVVLLRVLLSMANVVVLVVVINKLVPDFRFAIATAQISKRLGSFSAFAYLSKIASVVYAQADKVIIGSMIGMVSLTFYVIPFTLVNRVLSMSYRLASVIYPVASEMHSTNELQKLRGIYFSGTRYIFYLNLCITLLFVIFSREILYYWMGPSYAEQGSWVMVLVALAILVDSLTNLPSMLNDGFGHPRITGIFALMRAVLGLLITYLLTMFFGIIGAALGHLIASAVLTTLFMIYVHRHTIPYRLGELLREAYLEVVLFGLLVVLVSLGIKPVGVMPLEQTMGFIMVLIMGFIMFGYWVVLHKPHRLALSGMIKNRLPGLGNK